MTLSKYFRERLYKNLFEKTWPLWVGAILSAFFEYIDVYVFDAFRRNISCNCRLGSLDI